MMITYGLDDNITIKWGPLQLAEELLIIHEHMYIVVKNKEIRSYMHK